MKSFCDDIDLDCDECYEATVTDCEGFLVSGDLLPNFTYYLFVLDKFRNEYSAEITTNNNGSFIVDPSDFTDYLFNSYGGNYELSVSQNVNGSPSETLTIGGNEYSCVILTYTVCCVPVAPAEPVECLNILDFSEPCDSQYIPIF